MMTESQLERISRNDRFKAYHNVLAGAKGIKWDVRCDDWEVTSGVARIGLKIRAARMQ